MRVCVTTLKKIRKRFKPKKLKVRYVNIVEKNSQIDPKDTSMKNIKNVSTKTFPHLFLNSPEIFLNPNEGDMERHGKGFSPVWVISCFFMFDFSKKLFSQKEHAKGSSPV